MTLNRGTSGAGHCPSSQRAIDPGPTLVAAEELFLGIERAAATSASPLPPPLAGGLARAAVLRIWAAVASGRGDVAPDDLLLLATAVDVVRRAVLDAPESVVATAVDSHVPRHHSGDTAARLVFLAEIGQVHDDLAGIRH